MKKYKAFFPTILHIMRMNKSVLHWARLKHLTFWMMSPAQWGRGNSYSLGFTAAAFLLVSQDFRLSCNYGIFVTNVLSDEWEGKPCACLRLGPVCPMIIPNQLWWPHQQKKWDSPYWWIKKMSGSFLYTCYMRLYTCGGKNG